MKCEIVGMLNGGGYERMHDIGRRVYLPDGVAPTMHTCGGGNLEPKIVTDDAIAPIVYDDYNGRVRADQSCIGTLTTNCGNDAPRNGVKLIEPTVDKSKRYRIRKLTQRECFKLMGVRVEDYEKIAKNQSKSSLYHLAGDSIGTTCLMAILGIMLPNCDYQTKIKELAEQLKNSK